VQRVARKRLGEERGGSLHTFCLPLSNFWYILIGKWAGTGGQCLCLSHGQWHQRDWREIAEPGAQRAILSIALRILYR
jgi:hypothetical protein